MSNEIVTVMDHNNFSRLRVCYRHIGTVIVRFKMEVSRVFCCQRDVCPESDCLETVHRASACEQCSRTRIISQYSDCDSGIVDKSRRYRSSAARSRYVNVCAAFYLLLLVGSFPSQSSAAPRRNRSTTMERQKRETNSDSELWENPCDLKRPFALNVADPKEVAPKLIQQAQRTISTTSQYKDTLARELHSYDNFASLVPVYDGSEWLRKFGLPEEVLPKEKVLNKEVSDEILNKLIENIDTVLPSMNKALKLIVAGLNAFSKQGFTSHIIADASLKESINQTMLEARSVLCYFNSIMISRNHKVLPLPDSEIPVFTKDNTLDDGVLLLRDTLNYLELLVQVFKKLY